MRDKDEALRHCPTCGGTADHLGLRDYRWLDDALPGKVGPTDIDGVIEQSSTERVLMLEFKPASEPLTLGQRLTLRTFVRKGCDVWVVWDRLDQDGSVGVGSMDRHGNTLLVANLSLDQLKAKVRTWWDAGLTDR